MAAFQVVLADGSTRDVDNAGYKINEGGALVITFDDRTQVTYGPGFWARIDETLPPPARRRGNVSSATRPPRMGDNREPV
jgi:hypothetical protein